MQSSFQNAINMKASLLFLHQEDSFNDEERLKELRKYPLHIYLICRSPRIFLDNSKTNINDDNISLTFYTTIGGMKKEIVQTIVNSKEHPIAKIECEYPYNMIKAFSPDGKLRTEVKTTLLLKITTYQNNDYFNEQNLEVLYVGQAFGKNGERITIDRLKAHEKAQKIYYETQQRFPDHEVWFLSLTFEPLLFTFFKPWGDINPDLFETELEHQEKVTTTPITLNQQITIMEAALIKYFNTYDYNKEYIDFPSPEHKSYDEIYNLDFNSAAFELTSKSINTKLWSNDIEPTFFHCKDFFLHSNTDRTSMFKWYEKK